MPAVSAPRLVTHIISCTPCTSKTNTWRQISTHTSNIFFSTACPPSRHCPSSFTKLFTAMPRTRSPSASAALDSLRSCSSFPCALSHPCQRRHRMQRSEGTIASKSGRVPAARPPAV
eukprot:827762-Rhodomonas_salina.2